MENELYVTIFHKETIDACKLNIKDVNKPFFGLIIVIHLMIRKDWKNIV